jgi:hypothetical protein
MMNAEGQLMGRFESLLIASSAAVVLTGSRDPGDRAPADRHFGFDDGGARRLGA